VFELRERHHHRAEAIELRNAAPDLIGRDRAGARAAPGARADVINYHPGDHDKVKRFMKYVPKYVPPREAAENRARMRAWIFWTAVGLPILFALFAFGYSDQAPAMLRNLTIAVDRSLGFPMLWLLTTLAGR
jgi:hypothetical protein